MKKNQMLKYILPGIVGLLFNSLYIIVDGIFVANILGSNALAAVTIVVPIVEILIALSLMVSIGCGVYISANMGRRKEKEAREYFNNGLTLMIGLSLVITTLFLLFNKKIVGFLGATDLIFEETREYFIWFTFFIPCFMLNYALGTWVRNDGKPKLAMIGQIIGAILNVCLDYIFMGPMRMGIKGAAIATGLGPIIGIIILLPHFIKKRGNLYLEKTKIERKKMKKILLGGLPSFAIEFSLGLITFLCNIFIGYKFQEIGLSAFGVIGYINLIMLSIYLGIGQGTQPLISYLDGQNKPEEIQDIYIYSLKIAIGTGLLAYLLLYFAKPLITGIFIDSSDIELRSLTLKAIDLFFVGVVLTGINIITASLFEAKQSIKDSILISAGRSFIFLLPTLMILNKMSNPMLIWLAVPISELITLILSFNLWKKDERKYDKELKFSHN